MGDAEIMGNGHLQSFLGQSLYLTPYISSNDKTPSWDGHILVYNGKKKEKSIKGQILIQIKSTTVNKIKKKTITHSYKVKDLQNYLSNHGTILFKILCNHPEYRIYYRSLLPSDLRAIIKSSKKQSYKSIEHYLLDTSSLSQIESICENFLLHQNLQYGNTDYKLSIEESKELFIPFVSNGISVEDWLLNNEQILYGTKEIDGVKCYIGEIRIGEIESTVASPICIEEKKYFEEYSIRKTKTNTIIEIGKGISIDYENKLLSLSPSGSISEQLFDLEFLYTLFTKRTLSFGVSEPIQFRISSEDNHRDGLLRISQNIKLLNEIKNLLGIFRIDANKLEMKSGGFDSLDAKSKNNLEILISIFVRNEKVDLKPLPLGLHIWSISNLKIGLFIYSLESDANHKILDLFNLHENFKMAASLTNGEKIYISPYVILKAPLLVDVANLDLNVVVNAVKEYHPNANYELLVNQLGLELIKAFDISHREEFLNAANSIFRWLCEAKVNYDSNLLNLLQINLRSEPLSREESDVLLSLRDKYLQFPRKEGSDYYLCGISILLENKSDAKQFFEKLSEQAQDEFKTYPIFTLAKTFGIFQP